MNEVYIRKYASLMQELGLTGLEITLSDQTVRLERVISAPAKESSIVSTLPTYTAAPSQEGENVINVKSPIVGVFYKAPAENAEPYVSVGDHVQKGQILCVVEAMKLPHR